MALIPNVDPLYINLGDQLQRTLSQRAQQRLEEAHATLYEQEAGAKQRLNSAYQQALATERTAQQPGAAPQPAPGAQPQAAAAPPTGAPSVPGAQQQQTSPLSQQAPSLSQQPRGQLPPNVQAPRSVQLDPQKVSNAQSLLEASDPNTHTQQISQLAQQIAEGSIRKVRASDYPTAELWAQANTENTKLQRQAALRAYPTAAGIYRTQLKDALDKLKLAERAENDVGRRQLLKQRIDVAEHAVRVTDKFRTMQLDPDQVYNRRLSQDQADFDQGVDPLSRQDNAYNNALGRGQYQHQAAADQEEQRARDRGVLSSINQARLRYDKMLQAGEITRDQHEEFTNRLFDQSAPQFATQSPNGWFFNSTPTYTPAPQIQPRQVAAPNFKPLRPRGGSPRRTANPGGISAEDGPDHPYKIGDHVGGAPLPAKTQAALDDVETEGSPNVSPVASFKFPGGPKKATDGAAMASNFFGREATGRAPQLTSSRANSDGEDARSTGNSNAEADTGAGMSNAPKVGGKRKGSLSYAQIQQLMKEYRSAK